MPVAQNIDVGANLCDRTEESHLEIGRVFVGRPVVGGQMGVEGVEEGAFMAGTRPLFWHSQGEEGTGEGWESTRDGLSRSALS